MNIRLLAKAVLPLLALLAASRAPASDVDPANRYSWCPNVGWLNWQGNETEGVRIHATFASGSIYSGNIGWISLGDGTPADGTHYANTYGDDCGVNVDAANDPDFMLFSGLGWAPNAGWINFDVAAAIGDADRPRIEKATGFLRGYTWSPNLGWLLLDSSPVANVRILQNTAADFPFTDGTQGWQFLAVPSVFTPPNHSNTAGDPGILTTQATNNTGTFGWWESPVIDLNPSPGTIVAADFRMYSDQPTPGTVPTIRLRSSAINSQQSDLLSIESNGPASLSPTTTPRTQSMYWMPAASSPQVGLEIDMLNFMPDDAPTGTVNVDQVVLRRFLVDPFANATPEREFTFDASQEGFTFNTLPGIFDAATPGYDSANGRLYMQIVPTSGFEFSWWGSPEHSNLLQPAAGRLYRADFTIGCSISDASKVPGFRLRVNESSFQASQSLVVASTANGANSPTSGSSKTYSVIFPAEAGVGDYLIFSFDSYTGAGEGDSTNARLYLENLRVTSILTPP